MSKLLLGLALRDIAGPSVAEVASAAEGAGFTHLYLPETGHAGLSTGVSGRDPFLNAASALAATRTLQVGPGVAASVLRPARLMALAAATAHESSGGRFLLGCGVTHRPAVESLGLAYPASPLGHIREYLDELRAFSADRSNFGAGFPVLLGALGDKMIATAATHADGLVLNWLTVDGAAEAVDRYRAALPDGKAPGEVALLVRAGPHASLVDDAATYNERLPNYTKHFRRQELHSTEDVVRATCMSDDVAVIAERLRTYRDAGVTIPCLYPSGLAPDDVCQLVGEVGAALAAGASA